MGSNATILTANVVTYNCLGRMFQDTENISCLFVRMFNFLEKLFFWLTWRINQSSQLNLMKKMNIILNWDTKITQ